MFSKILMVSGACLSLALLGGCNSQQTTQAAAIVDEVCAVAGVATAVIATDGAIVAPNSTQAQQEISEGQQLITVNCAATQQAIAALAAAMAANPAPVTPTALVSMENEYASKLHISPAVLRKVVRHYVTKN
jgi:hypothetical protein